MFTCCVEFPFSAQINVTKKFPQLYKYQKLLFFLSKFPKLRRTAPLVVKLVWCTYKVVSCAYRVVCCAYKVVCCCYKAV